MALQEAEGAQAVLPNDVSREMTPDAKVQVDANQLKAPTIKVLQKIKLPEVSIDFFQLKKLAASRATLYKPALCKITIVFVLSFIFLTVYLSGTRLCKPRASQKTSCLALGLCSNRNDPHGSLANKIKSNIICPLHNVVDHVVEKTSAAITGSEDPFGTESMVPGIDLSVLIF